MEELKRILTITWLTIQIFAKLDEYLRKGK